MRAAFFLVVILASAAFGQSNPAGQSDPQAEAEVKQVIEKFLTAAGNYDADAAAELFAEQANISGASLRDGNWGGYTVNIQEFIKNIRYATNPKKYTEPVNHWTIHVDGRRLAFVRADATLYRDGQVQRHNIDYFTLIKTGEQWKILNGSYVSLPPEPAKK